MSKCNISYSLLCQQCGIVRPKLMIHNLSLCNKGSKRRRKKLKQSLGLKVTEGKNLMSFQVCSFCAESCLKVAKESAFLNSMHSTKEKRGTTLADGDHCWNHCKCRHHHHHQ